MDGLRRMKAQQRRKSQAKRKERVEYCIIIMNFGGGDRAHRKQGK